MRYDPESRNDHIYHRDIAGILVTHAPLQSAINTVNNMGATEILFANLAMFKRIQ
jgi:hypothetical protein